MNFDVSFFGSYVDKVTITTAGGVIMHHWNNEQTIPSHVAPFLIDVPSQTGRDRDEIFKYFQTSN